MSVSYYTTEKDLFIMTLTLLFDILHTQVAVKHYDSFCQNSILFCKKKLGGGQTTHCSPKVSFPSSKTYIII